MSDSEDIKLEDKNTCNKEKLKIMQDIENRVLNDPHVPAGVKSELQNVNTQVRSSQ